MGIGVDPPIRPFGHEFFYSKHTRGTDTGQGPSFGCADQEGTVDNDACTDRIYRFLGTPQNDTSNTSNAGGIKNFGIPGYYTDLTLTPPAFPTFNPPGGQSIRYRIYKVQGLGTPTPGLVGAPYMVTLVGDYSPYGNITSPNEWLEFDNSQTYNSYQMVRYVTRDQKTPAYSPSIGTAYNVGLALVYLDELAGNPGLDFPTDPGVGAAVNGLITGRWPVTIYTDFNTTQTFSDDLAGAGPGVYFRPKYELVRAYIIQAYNPDIAPNLQYNQILQQAVIYGKKEDLAPIEGAAIPNNATVNFETQYLKVGHNYLYNGIPAGTYGQNSLTSQPNSIFPGDIWVRFPRRYFT